MAKKSGFLFGLMMLIVTVGCGGSSSAPAPTPTPTPSQVFPNDQSLAQSAPVKLGTSGGNANDLGTKVCCIGTLGSLWTKTGVTRPVILSNNHVLDRSGNGAAGEAINQPLQLACTAPGAPPPLTVALLTQGAPLKPVANVPGACGPTAPSPLCGPSPSNVDAAIAEIAPGQVDLSGTILDLGPVGTTSIGPQPPSSTIGTPALSQGVAKSGRTTGLTCSTITSLNASIQVNYDAKCGDTSPAFTAIFTNQVVINGGTFSASGDSGSLVVTTDTARPVALLYGGSTTDTVANPISDVIAAFGGSGAFSIIGGADHAVSCARTATAGSTQVGAAQAALLPQEHQRVTTVQQRRAAQLLQDTSIKSVTVGASADNPNEGALLIHVAGSAIPQIAATVDGVRTRLVFDDSVSQHTSIGAQLIDRAMIVKDAHVGSLLGQSGIQGVGVALSLDNPAEAAVSIYLVKGVAHQPIPPVIDGVRTRIFEGDRFRAY
ncbi:MAG: hypothetical protein JWM83_1472 [Candidatus Angelobacter sp.]|nr:hypothetical protein [Candidatus Angelobacter sp.]